MTGGEFAFFLVFFFRDEISEAVDSLLQASQSGDSKPENLDSMSNDKTNTAFCSSQVTQLITCSSPGSPSRWDKPEK